MPTKIENLSDETRDELANLAVAIGQNPETRKPFLGLLKKVAPHTPIPELDAEATIEARLKAEREERQKFEQKQEERWLQKDLSERKQGVMQKYNLSDEQMKQMEERMGKKELPHDYEWAARLYTQEIEPVGATNYGSGGFGPFEMPAADGLMENEQNWSLKTAHQMIDDVQRKARSNSF